MGYYQLNRVKDETGEYWVIKPLSLTTDIPKGAHPELNRVDVVVAGTTIRLPMSMLVIGSEAWITDSEFQRAIERWERQGIYSKNKAEVTKTVTISITEIKEWVKKLKLGDARKVTVKSKDIWLKKILKKLEKIEGKEPKLIKRAHITIKQETGFKAGKEFLVIERDEKERNINLGGTKALKSIQIGKTIVPIEDIINIAKKIRKNLKKGEM